MVKLHVKLQTFVCDHVERPHAKRESREALHSIEETHGIEPILLFSGDQSRSDTRMIHPAKIKQYTEDSLNILYK